MVSYEQYYYTLGNVVVTANYECSKIKGSKQQGTKQNGSCKKVFGI